MSNEEKLHDESVAWPDDPVPESTLHPDHTPVTEEHPEKDVVTFWDIVRRQFMANRVAVFALRSVFLLIFLATTAPLISLNIPYVWKGPDGVEFPLFVKLFDRNIFPSGVDIFFNLLLILGPLWWAGAKLLRSMAIAGGKRNPKQVRVWGAVFGLLVLTYVLLGFAKQSLFWHVLFMGMVGVVLLYWNAKASLGLPARDVRRRRANMRYVLGGVFAVTFTLILFVFDFTSPTVIYRTELEKSEDMSLSPPIFFHPNNTADDNSIALERSLKPPSTKSGNLLGTDANGRDVFSRLLYGTRISLTIGIIAVSIYVTIGIILGSFAGYFGGKVDLFIMFVLQVMMCIPTFFLLLTIIALFDTRSIFMIMVAIGLTGWTGVTRLVRGEFFRQRSIEYVTAAKCLGIPERKIIFGHILKNSVGPVLVATAFGIAGAILAESFLSFLGLGDTNAPSWGQILREGQTENKAWLIFSPGLAIFFVVTILNLVGEGLRDALDPKLRH
ncbi:MAG: ABC transporter permease [Planctomycetota bacterium]